MRKTNSNLLVGLIMVMAFGLAGFGSSAEAQTRKVKANFSPDTAAQQPLFTEYRGIHLGMTASEARAKLGAPMLKADDGDFYGFSETETLQLVYDVDHKVSTISVDFMGGVGAPDYKAVVVGELEPTINGGLYRMMRYQSQGFWVSYHRSSGPVLVVTITIQKMP